jgi:quinol monooxygenase YgiN
MIHTLVIFHVQPGRAAEFESAHRKVVALMGTQAGCLEIKVHRSLDDSLEYMVYGSWESKDAWDRAHQTPRFKELFKSLPLVEHTLSRGSFFELAYATAGRSAPER